MLNPTIGEVKKKSFHDFLNVSKISDIKHSKYEAIKAGMFNVLETMECVRSCVIKRVEITKRVER